MKNNKPFFKLLALQVIFALQWVSIMVLFSYFCIHNLGHVEWIPILTTSGLAASIAITAALPYLGRRIEKRKIIFIGCILLLISAVILGFVKGFFSVLIFQPITGIGNGMIFTTVGAMWPEVTDYTEWKTGMVTPGIIIATSMFCFKIFNAFSAYGVGAILSLGGYDATLEVQSDYTLLVIKVGMVISIVVCIAVVIVTNIKLHELSTENFALYREDKKNRSKIKIES